MPQGSESQNPRSETPSTMARHTPFSYWGLEAHRNLTVASTELQTKAEEICWWLSIRDLLYGQREAGSHSQRPNPQGEEGTKCNKKNRMGG